MQVGKGDAAQDDWGDGAAPAAAAASASGGGGGGAGDDPSDWELDLENEVSTRAPPT